jgi:polyisoprenoid-binding protein YceI
MVDTEGAVRFTVDAPASLFTVQAFAAGIVSVVAHSPKFAIRDIVGEVKFVHGNLQTASIKLSVNVGSLEIMDEVRASDRREIERVMFDEVLEKKTYPKVEYKSSKVTPSNIGENMYRVNIAGEVLLHGITRGLGLDSQVVVGEDSIRAQGTFTLMQTDFGLKIASVAGGTLKLKDEIKFAYFLIGRRQT